MDHYDALGALTNLVETCRLGNFYQDYDASWELLGKADEAIGLLTPLLHQVQS